jgi:hypothetical protein
MGDGGGVLQRPDDVVRLYGCEPTLTLQDDLKLLSL